MAISITCPGCQSVYPVPETLVGKTIRCKKCGEMVAVTAPAAAPVAARPVAAKPAARVVDDDDAAIPVRPARARRDLDDEDAAPPAGDRGKPEKKGSKLPLVLGAVLGGLVLGAAGVGALFAAGLFGGDTKPTDVVENTRPPVTPAVTRPGGRDDEGEKAVAPADTNAAAKGGTPKQSKANGEKPLVFGPAPVTATPPAPTTSPTAGVVKGQGPTKENIDTVTLNQCKHAAVLIRADLVQGGAAYGSAWFGMEANLIFTNAHVIGMIVPGSPKPAKLTVWVNPGTPQEKEIPHAKMEILAVDRDMDLAVIKVMNETGLPAPLKVRPSSELRDLERLVVLGYPGGTRLAKKNMSDKPPAVTIAEARVQTLRKDDNGNLYSVQLQSNVVHGNSGGPIVDADGNVVAVAVRVDLDEFGRFTGIAYGVPTEYVVGLLAGRVGEVEYGQPYKKGGKVHIPVTAHCLDPLERLKGVGVGFWIGEADKAPRPPGTERAAETGDLHYTEAALAYKHSKDDPKATGEIVLPELPAGRAYWSQPYYANALVSRYWKAGNKLKMTGPPVDLEPADLIVRYRTGSRRPLTLENNSSLEEFEEGEDRSQRLVVESKMNMTETVQRPSDSGAVASLLLSYEKLALKGHIGDRTLELPKDLRDFLVEGFKRVQAIGHVNKSGQIYKTLTNVRDVMQFAPIFKALSDDALESLAGASIPLPNTRAEPNFTWKDQKSYRLQVTFATASDALGPAPKQPPGPGGRMSQPEPKKSRSREYKYQQNVTYTYLGSRTRAGVKEAVVKIEGTISTAPGTSADSGATGRLKGYAYIDLDTGTVLEAEVEKDLEVDSSADNIKKRISGTNKYKLSRGSAITG